jgi:uncharacterized protein (DUF1330 family)
MAKGYWIAHVDVRDPDDYKNYIAANAIPFAKYGAKFLVRGGESRMLSGSLRQRHVVIEFADYATALACHDSPEYQHAAAIRDRASTIDLVIIEGYDGPQPGSV